MSQKNRQSDLKPKYSSSSEDEESQEASGSEESGSESEQVSVSDSDRKQKQEPNKPVIPPSPSATKPPPPDPSSSDEEESGSDTESDSPPKKSPVPDSTIKSPAKKSEAKASSVPTPAKSKRPRPAPVKEKDAKKANKVKPADDDVKKKMQFQRLWSEEDEIALLQGMIDLKTEKNCENPAADIDDFHEYIKGSIHIVFSNSQLSDKVRKLKSKYLKNASTEENGEEIRFAKSHDQKIYGLSKKIWGGISESNKSGAERKKAPARKNKIAKKNSAAVDGKSNGEKEVLCMEVGINLDVSRFVHYGGTSHSPVVEDEIVKAGLHLVEESKREEWVLRWDKLKKMELELYVKRKELVKELTDVVLEAMNLSAD